MPAKKKGRKRKTGGKRRGAKRRRRTANPLGKRGKTAVKKMIDKALDIRIEDKYLLDSVFTNQAASSWDAATESMLINFTPTIVEGADTGQRIGKKVTLKNLRIQLKYVPYSRHFVSPLQGNSGEVAYATNPYQQLPNLEVFFIRIPRQVYTDVSGNELRKACAVKFREPGLYRQDMVSNTGQGVVKAIKLLAKTKLKRKYRTSVTLRDAYTDAGVDYAQSAVFINAAQMDYAVLKHKFMKKTLFEDNQPANYVYLLYAHSGSKWHDSYNGTITRPSTFSSRVLWTYEDA